MDKAARAVRRSGVRLRASLGNNASGDLSVCSSEWREVKNAAKAFMAAQTSAAEFQMKWASHSENRALLDVTNQVWELYKMWAEVQQQFIAVGLKEYQRVFELLGEDEHQLHQQQSDLKELTDKEEKLRRELKKTVKRSSNGNQKHELQAQLSLLEDQKHAKEHLVDEEAREQEVIKMIRIRQGLERLACSYEKLGSSCQILFSAQRQLAQLLPEAGDDDIENLRYEGPVQARDIVKDVKVTLASLGTEIPKGEKYDEYPEKLMQSPVKNRSPKKSRNSFKLSPRRQTASDSLEQTSTKTSSDDAGILAAYGNFNPPYNPAFLQSHCSEYPPTGSASFGLHRRRTFPSAPPAYELTPQVAVLPGQPTFQTHASGQSLSLFRNANTPNLVLDNASNFFPCENSVPAPNAESNVQSLYPSLDSVKQYAERKSYPLTVMGRLKKEII